MSINHDLQIIIGLVEPVTLNTKNGLKTFLARIDTGASRSSLDKELASELNLGPVLKEMKIRSAHGRSIRPVINIEINLANKKLNGEFTLASRNHMKFPILIGRNILEQGFLIDATKNKKELGEKK